MLRGVSFDVQAGELVCLVGRNGAGKTTSFRTIMGFRKPVAGSIEFDGQDLVGAAAVRDRSLGRWLCARGERGLWRAHGGREHRVADLDLSGSPQRPGTHRRRFSGLPAPRALPRSRRRRTFRRRAQDGVDRAGAGARAKAAAAGRADRGPFARDRAGDRCGPRRASAPSATRCSSPNPTSTMCRTSPTGSM